MTSNKPRLAELRKQAELTQAALAQQLDITQGQVSRYEETGDVPILLINLWAQLLGVTAEEFLAAAGGGDGGEDEENACFTFDNSLYSSLTEDLNLLLQYIDRFPHLEEPSSESVSPTVAQFRDRVVALKEKPWVVVTGHFDAGKSHLCNFYLGGRLLPASYRPTTKYPTFVHHVSDRPEWFKEDLWLMGPKFEPEKWHDEQHCTQNRRLAGSWDTLEQHATWKGVVKEGSSVYPSSTPWVADYQGSEEGTVLAFVDAPLLHSCVLVDLPGYDDTVTNAALLDKVGRQASVLLYICRAQGFIDGGDFSRLSNLLRNLSHYEAVDKNFPMLGNLFIVASHAHRDITTDQLEKEILEGGARDLYEHFKKNLLKDLEPRLKRTVQLEDVEARFCSFWQELPVRRKKLQAGMYALLGTHMPSIREKRIEKEIVSFKEQGTAAYAKQVDRYEKILRDKSEAKSLLERLKNAEPVRKKEHNAQVKNTREKITTFRERDLEHLRAVFGNETRVENLEAMIEKRYSDKKAAQKYAAVYVLEEIQSKTARFRSGLVDDTRNLIEQFLKDYDAQMGKFSNAAPGESGFSFDARAAFLGGLAGLGTLGALGAWAATLGNLGGYIIVAKVAAALGLSSASAAGAAGVTSVVAALGGPIILGLAIAVGVGALVWRIFAGNWRYRLAKKIGELFVEKRVLSTLEETVKRFWDETLTAFQKGADGLDEQYRNHIEEMKTAFGGRQENLQVLERRLKRYEERKSFFAAIPWRLRM